MGRAKSFSQPRICLRITDPVNGALAQPIFTPNALSLPGEWRQNHYNFGSLETNIKQVWLKINQYFHIFHIFHGPRSKFDPNRQHLTNNWPRCCPSLSISHHLQGTPWNASSFKSSHSMNRMNNRHGRHGPSSARAPPSKQGNAPKLSMCSWKASGMHNLVVKICKSWMYMSG